jgi:hypothetical protein
LAINVVRHAALYALPAGGRGCVAAGSKISPQASPEGQVEPADEQSLSDPGKQ